MVTKQNEDCWFISGFLLVYRMTYRLSLLKPVLYSRRLCSQYDSIKGRHGVDDTELLSGFRGKLVKMVGGGVQEQQPRMSSDKTLTKPLYKPSPSLMIGLLCWPLRFPRSVSWKQLRSCSPTEERVKQMFPARAPSG